MLSLKPGVSVEDAVKNLKARPDVEYAEPDTWQSWTMRLETEGSP